MYKTYNEISTELLDSLKVGDMVKFDSEKTSYKIKGVSKNYIVMTQNLFGKIYYCIVPKKPMKYGHNVCYLPDCGFHNGSFVHAPDAWIFGCDIDDDNLYEFNNENSTNLYLQQLEDEETQISIRRAKEFNSISVKNM